MSRIGRLVPRLVGGASHSALAEPGVAPPLAIDTSSKDWSQREQGSRENGAAADAGGRETAEVAMMTYSQLIELEHSLRQTAALSVYVNGEVKDPALRLAWNQQLEHALTELRATLADAPRAERQAFDRCLALLDEELGSLGASPRSRGWVAFITPDGVRYAGTVSVAVPSLVWWGQGIRVAPLLCALKELRPAIVAVVDGRKARLYRYRGGTLERLGTLRARARLELAQHVGTAARERSHPGPRGRTGAEESARDRRVARERMMAELADRLVELSGPDGWLIIGGTREAAHEAHAALPEALEPRALVVRGLHSHASDAEITRAAAEGASTLRRRRDCAVVRRVIERAGANGLGVTRLEPTRRALAARAVQELLLTSRFIEQHPAEAEEAVRAAFDQGALVEQISGEGAEQLDAESDGIGATLRFVPGQG